MCNSQLLLCIQLILYRNKILNVLNILIGEMVGWLVGFVQGVRIPQSMLLYDFIPLLLFIRSTTPPPAPSLLTHVLSVHEVYKRTFNTYDTYLLLDLMHYIMMRINQIYFIPSYNRNLTIRNKNDGCF